MTESGNTPKAVDWTGWRGAGRDGRVTWLPERLPQKLKLLWRQPLTQPAHAGIAATRREVIVADRDLADTFDVFRCFHAQTGRELWTYRYPASGKLDYGNSPRATPLIDGKHVILQGALGQLTCVHRETGQKLWQQDLRTEFDITASLPWGLCGSPLIAGGKVIVYPGGEDGAIAALDLASGEIAWRAPGKPASYGSLILAELGGKTQLVGHDAETLGGWDPADGKRLWTVTPRIARDFNVPTPVVYRGQLIVATENNGTRLFRFSAGGQIIAESVAHFDDLSPDTQTPVVIGTRLFGVSQRLYCLDLEQRLKPIWKSEDSAFDGHVSLIASPTRLLACTETGEVLLIDPTANKFRLLSRVSPFSNESGLLSHPAVVGTRLYLRASREIDCFSLN